ncbi:Sigma-W factor [Luteitalea pratensis]|uniref:Sigma-W factor n=1 Tax=Luteitalea pratensis TaxID=1855912 RepID=A0A143PL05_LUTPR|nr:sigma-70 family RNA polymerase sigma factor [Luteitalea pratensis]AMY08439.1 Sigma-W factor [Luteitalea pratensis]
MPAHETPTPKRIACGDVVRGCTFTASAPTEEVLVQKGLYRIATNAALMLRRARTRRPTESLEAFLPRFDAQGVHLATPAELHVASRADELLDRQVLAEKAHEVIARLPDVYRDAFVLRDLEEMSTADVALALGVEPATVRQLVHRARLMLRGYLSDLVGVKP